MSGSPGAGIPHPDWCVSLWGGELCVHGWAPSAQEGAWGFARMHKNLLRRVTPWVSLEGSMVNFPPHKTPVLHPGPSLADVTFPSTESLQNRFCFTFHLLHIEGFINCSSTFCTQWGFYQLFFLKVKSDGPQRTHFPPLSQLGDREKRVLGAFLRMSTRTQFKPRKGVPWWCNRLRIQRHHCDGSGDCYGMGLIPDLACFGSSLKRKKQNKTKLLYVSAELEVFCSLIGFHEDFSREMSS